MLHKSFLGLLLAPLLVLVAGCCANNPCDCNDSLADSLFFAFDKSFTDTELDTVYISRRIVKSTQAPDSLPLPLAIRRPTTLAAQINFAGQNDRGLVVISNNAPFSQTSTNANLSRYTYRLSVQKDTPIGSPRVYYTYNIDQVSIAGRYVADGCCTCYRNSHKGLRVQAPVGGTTTMRIVFADDANDQNNNSYPRTPVVVQLTK